MVYDAAIPVRRANMSETKTTDPSIPAQEAVTNGAAQWELDPAMLPNLDELVTEDGKPVDNLYVERLHKLLVEPLYVSWRPPGDQPRSYMAMSNVGWFHAWKEPAVVPDMMLSLDVTARDPGTREGRSYFQWIHGKPPDLAIEVVSDQRADEDGDKLRLYLRLCLPYYVIHDPDDILGGGILRAFELRGRKYAAIDPRWIEQLGLGLVMWDGEYQGITRNWLRWCDREGKVIPTGAELAHQFQQQVENVQQQVEDAEARIRRLQDQLRAQGIEPEV
jgi:Putative restriction endonuclease